MATRHTYASADDLRDYLAGTSYSSGWTADAGSLRRVLESASRRIDQYCEGGTFGPLTETRYYDIGSGSLVQSPQYAVLAGTDDIATTVSLASVIPLDGWLISTTTVTAYDDTDRGGSTVLTEGHANDFFLMPYNVNPKTIFKLNEDTSNTLDAGQQTLSILGSWGYTADTLSVTTADGYRVNVCDIGQRNQRGRPGSGPDRPGRFGAALHNGDLWEYVDGGTGSQRNNRGDPFRRSGFDSL